MRSPSGVTRMKLRAVAGPSLRAARIEMHPLRAQIMGEKIAQLILLDLAEIGRAVRRRRQRPPRYCRPSRRISRSPAPYRRKFFGAFPHRSIASCPWRAGVLSMKLSSTAGKHIDNGIADGEHVESRRWHDESLNITTGSCR